jgi:hypothetical protein
MSPDEICHFGGDGFCLFEHFATDFEHPDRAFRSLTKNIFLVLSYRTLRTEQWLWEENFQLEKGPYLLQQSTSKLMFIPCKFSGEEG